MNLAWHISENSESIYHRGVKAESEARDAICHLGQSATLEAFRALNASCIPGKSTFRIPCGIPSPLEYTRVHGRSEMVN